VALRRLPTKAVRLRRTGSHPVIRGYIRRNPDYGLRRLNRPHPGAVRCHFLRQGKGRLCVAGCGAVARLDGSSCVYGLLRLGRCPQPRSVRNQKGACQPHCRRKLLRGTRSRASGTVALPVLKRGYPNFLHLFSPNCVPWVRNCARPVIGWRANEGKKRRQKAE